MAENEVSQVSNGHAPHLKTRDRGGHQVRQEAWRTSKRAISHVSHCVSHGHARRARRTRALLYPGCAETARSRLL